MATFSRQTNDTRDQVAHQTRVRNSGRLAASPANLYSGRRGWKGGNGRKGGNAADRSPHRRGCDAGRGVPRRPPVFRRPRVRSRFRPDRFRGDVRSGFRNAGGGPSRRADLHPGHRSPARSPLRRLSPARGSGAIQPHHLRRGAPAGRVDADGHGGPLHAAVETGAGLRRVYRHAPAHDGADDVARWLPVRQRDAHKWHSAVRMVAGSPGMTGAAALASCMEECKCPHQT